MITVVAKKSLFHRRLEKDLLKRNLALKTLTDEYEIAKAKVRKYRAEKFSLDNKENIDNNAAYVGHVAAENEVLKKSKVVLEKEVHRLGLEVDRLLGDMSSKARTRDSLDQEKREADRSSSGSATFDRESLVQAVKHEMSRLRASFVRQGSERAISKATTVFSSELQRLEKTHNTVIDLMRKRLEELADFLESILSNGLVDLSLLSNHVRDSLARSLNESRRLSMSFGPNSSFAPAAGDASFVGLGRIDEHPGVVADGDDATDPNETQGPSPEEPLPDFKLPDINIKVTFFYFVGSISTLEAFHV